MACSRAAALFQGTVNAVVDGGGEESGWGRTVAAIL